MEYSPDRQQADGGCGESTSNIIPSPARSNAAWALASLHEVSKNEENIEVSKISKRTGTRSRLRSKRTKINNNVHETKLNNENLKNEVKNAEKRCILSTNSLSRSNSLEYSRRAKSLGVLCTNFVQLYDMYPKSPCLISLDDAAVKLGVERRRIYDIVNILEALLFVRRQRKNTYLWEGCGGIFLTLQKLQLEAISIWPEDALSFGLKLNSHPSSSSVISSSTKMLHQNYNLTANSSTSSSSYPSFSENHHHHLLKEQDLMTEEKKGKSLGELCSRFVQLFLIGHKTVSLSTARDKSFGPNLDETKSIKTKVRRLYDIANVLISLGLIVKLTKNYGNKDPSFDWIGPSPLDIFNAKVDMDQQQHNGSNHYLKNNTDFHRVENEQDHDDDAEEEENDERPMNVSSIQNKAAPLSRYNTGDSISSMNSQLSLSSPSLSQMVASNNGDLQEFYNHEQTNDDDDVLSVGRVSFSPMNSQPSSQETIIEINFQENDMTHENHNDYGNNHGHSVSNMEILANASSSVFSPIATTQQNINLNQNNIHYINDNAVADNKNNKQTASKQLGIFELHIKTDEWPSPENGESVEMPIPPNKMLEFQVERLRKYMNDYEDRWELNHTQQKDDENDHVNDNDEEDTCFDTDETENRTILVDSLNNTVFIDVTADQDDEQEKKKKHRYCHTKDATSKTIIFSNDREERCKSELTISASSLNSNTSSSSFYSDDENNQSVVGLIIKNDIESET